MACRDGAVVQRKDQTGPPDFIYKLLLEGMKETLAKTSNASSSCDLGAWLELKGFVVEVLVVAVVN